MPVVSDPSPGPYPTPTADGQPDPATTARDGAGLGRSAFSVRFHELDPNGHVNHGVYANYFETARIELLEELGLGPTALGGRGVHLVVVELRIRFHRPAHAGDRLEVVTRVQELRRASSWWHQGLYRDEELLSEAEVRSAATDATGRPTAPPDDVMGALRGLMEESAHAP
jgi:acyl-CoA thioester hydrolase